MHTLLKRAIGLYFIVSALEYIPAGIFMVGVQNPYGPSWVNPAIPLVQGLIIAAAGFWLFRSSGSDVDLAIDLTWPPLESVLQLFGVYFVVGGLVSLARPLSGVLFFNESVASVPAVRSPRQRHRSQLALTCSRDLIRSRRT